MGRAHLWSVGYALGHRPAAGPRFLVPVTGVRIPLPQPCNTRSSKYLTCFELLFYLAHAKHQCEILAVSVWICQQAQLLSRAAAARFPPRGPLMPRTGIRPARRMRPKAQNMAAPQSSIQICAKSVMYTGIQGCVFAIVQVDGLSHPTLPGRLRILTTVSQIKRPT